MSFVVVFGCRGLEISAGVYVTLGDGSSGNLVEDDSMLVPYSRNVIASDDRNYETTAMTIGKTYREYLSGTPITNYPVLTLSSTRFVKTTVRIQQSLSYVPTQFQCSDTLTSARLATAGHVSFVQSVPALRALGSGGLR